MTYEEYIKNPSGKGSSAAGQRNLQLGNFADRWFKLRLREQKPPIFYLYKTKNDEDYIVHMKIPSEQVPKFYYDVIIRFFPPKDNGNVRQQKDLKNYNVQFFSNDPSFAYTFEHAFYVNNLFFVDLIPKSSPIFIKEKAIEKNPRDDIGYVKSLCFMYFAMRELKLFSKSSWINYTKYDKVVWRGTVEDTISKIHERQKLGHKDEKEKRKKEIKAEEAGKRNPINKVKELFKIPDSPNFKNVGGSVFNTINFKPSGKKKK